MRTVKEIYTEYNIPPGLQAHQLRVAAVAAYVCDYFDNTVDKERIVLAGLFHDMGNIIKSDVTQMPDLFEPEGPEYWQEVKVAFREKYGDDELHARNLIAERIGLSEDVIHLMKSAGFAKLETIVDQGSEELKIFQYGDSRVGPYGILSLEDRFREGRERAVKSGRVSGIATRADRFEVLLEKAKELETQLVSYAHFDPAEITDASIESTVNELWDYSVA